MQPEERTTATATAATLKGSVLAIMLHDISEEIRLEQLREILGARRLEPGFKHATPEYVRFEKPPVVERLEPCVLSSGETVMPQLKYYDYGVISVLLEFGFAAEWEELVRLAARWVPSPELERQAQQIVRGRLDRIAPAIVRPYSDWLSEDYYVFLLTDVPGNPRGLDLLAQRVPQIAQILRGEQMPVSRGECDEVLQASLSYYPNDLVAVGWNAALVYDTPAGAQTAVQILEYANSQLLEFRHYDELLTRELAGVYAGMKHRAGIVRRWKMRGEALRLNGVTVEVTELVERSDTAIKFVSDMFSARVYRLAAAKIGVPEYKNLVNEKLRTAEGLYRFLIDEFHQSRGFVLEVLVVIILVIELVYLFRGKG
ncbi:MAG TPA: hypothetical protein VL240_14530 [Candidatus Binatia bacterium]|nr:hypothetical protein [Candidatus Binatia bacterium]